MSTLLTSKVKFVAAGPEAPTDLRRLRRQHAAMLLVAFGALAYAFFPGHFDSDSGWMYGQSQDVRAISDAHSPLLTFLMSMTREFVPGPAILFVVQLATWMLGLWLISDTLIAAGYALAGVAGALAYLLPLTSYIFLDVNKDTAMAALGLALIGWLTRIAFFGWRPTAYSGLALAALAVAFLDMRQNAMIALAPLVGAFVFVSGRGSANVGGAGRSRAARSSWRWSPPTRP